jgi:hypothetical protein
MQHHSRAIRACAAGGCQPGGRTQAVEIAHAMAGHLGNVAIADPMADAHNHASIINANNSHLQETC